MNDLVKYFKHMYKMVSLGKQFPKSNGMKKKKKKKVSRFMSPKTTPPTLRVVKMKKRQFSVI